VALKEQKTVMRRPAPAFSKALPQRQFAKGIKRCDDSCIRRAQHALQIALSAGEEINDL
jgi:hypothetical protein